MTMTRQNGTIWLLGVFSSVSGQPFGADEGGGVVSRA